jgi:L-fuconolactonase
VLAEVAAQVPSLQIVIDHCAKPVITGGADAGDEWRRGMARLATLPQIMCKVSGLANEAGPDWTADALRPVVDHVLAQFGAERVMWGSDWPVLNLAGDYDRWRSVSDQHFEQLSAADRAAVYGGTAQRFYGLGAA